jgi:LPXTG-site transpeptidase (sortase) family protein
MSARGFRRSPGGRRARPLLLAGSVVCIVAALALAAQIAWFLGTSSSEGAALIGRERLAIRAGGRACRAPAGPTSPGSAGPTSPGSAGPTRPGHASPGPTRPGDTRPGHASPGSADSSDPEGLLEIPALGLVAPVLQGTGSEVLSRAVGHVPASAWPGSEGTTVLAAHDVTWFSRIDRLRAGDQIRYVTPCRTFGYRVTSHRVVQAGYPVYDTAAARIVLDTCYPLDALYTTSRRYLVYADLVETLPTSGAPPAPAGPAPAGPISVPAPGALAAEGLTLRQNPVPLGTLALSGAWTPGWRQSGGPLSAEAAALTGYFGIVRSAEQGEPGWWRDLAPSVPESAAAGLWHGRITGYETRLAITLRVRGSTVTGATITAGIILAGQPGTYVLTVTETVTGQEQLLVTGFTLRRLERVP